MAIYKSSNEELGRKIEQTTSEKVPAKKYHGIHPPEYWAERKTQLYDYLKQDIHALKKDVGKKFGDVLQKFYSNSLNRARIDLGLTLPIREHFVGRMLGLTKEDKKNIFILIGSGITYDTLESIYNISRKTLQTIVNEISFYRDVVHSHYDYNERIKDGIKTYKELYIITEKTKNELFIFDTLDKHLISPMVENISSSLNLDRVLTPTSPDEELLYKILDINPKEEVVKELFSLLDGGDVKGKAKLQKELIIRLNTKINHGDYRLYLTISDKEEIHSFLTNEERRVINSRYFEGHLPLEEIASRFKIPVSTTYKIHTSAIKKLKEYIKANTFTSLDKIKKLQAQLDSQSSKITELESAIKDYIVMKFLKNN